ncbi:MAG: DNA polymerase III subunit delta [Leptolyngbya sp. SIO1D8]|nr:DNA polymerase III subunit delta [Leptolyngbya sp. SIO1D8]
MPIYFFWGEDDFQLNRAITTLRDRTLDPAWASFNYDKIAGDIAEGPINALNQAMTPPFGSGQRFVWLTDTTLGQRCAETILNELTRTLPQLPETSVLVMSSRQKPDGRSKFTKLVQKHGEIREFSTIPPWKTDQLLKQVEKLAHERGINLTAEASNLLVEAVGNQTQQLILELEKLSLYWSDRSAPINAETVSLLVTASAQSSLKLATALCQGQTEQALGLLTDLLNRNEPALRIVSTLVGQFRRWLWVKLMAESGERDIQAIAKAAEISNPKRVYFLQKEVAPLALSSLRQAMAHLLELESGLKMGRNERAILQTKIIEISQLFANFPPAAYRYA